MGRIEQAARSTNTQTQVERCPESRPNLGAIQRLMRGFSEDCIMKLLQMPMWRRRVRHPVWGPDYTLADQDWSRDPAMHFVLGEQCRTPLGLASCLGRFARCWQIRAKPEQIGVSVGAILNRRTWSVSRPCPPHAGKHGRSRPNLARSTCRTEVFTRRALSCQFLMIILVVEHF